LQLGGDLFGKFLEVVGVNSGLNHLEVDVDSLVEARHHEEVIDKVVVAVACCSFSGNDAGIGLVLNKKKGTTKAAQ
jgi:hypothetical protein